MTSSIQGTAGAMLRSIKKIIRKAPLFLSALLIIISLTVFGLFIAGIRPYVVKTGSMEPAYPVNSLCFVNRNTPLEEISVGDVISFSMGKDTVVTHRVTSISGKEYTTKGDANLTEDSAPVTAVNYIGKIVYMIPKIGCISNFLHTRAGLLAAVALIVLLLIPNFIPDKEKDTASTENEQNDQTGN